MTSKTVLRRVLLGLVSLLLASGGLLAATVPAQADEAPKVLLLLDVSGSMNAKLNGGGSKFAAAKKALKQVAASLPAGTQVGLRVYGSDVEEEQDENPAACKDTRLVLPIGPLDRQQMNAAVDSFKAQGRDPDRVLDGQGGRRPRRLRQARADPRLRRPGDLREGPLPDRAEARRQRRRPAVQRHRARREQQGALPAAVHRQGRGRRVLRRERHRLPRAGPPQADPARAAALRGRRHPGDRHARTRPPPRRSDPGSTATPTTPAPSRATTRSTARPARW